MILHHLDVKESCPILKPSCVETGGNCRLDENDVIQCECPEDTEFIHNVGCKGKSFLCIINIHSFRKIIIIIS